jgi:serine/threonine-protein kinase RsbW
MIKVIRNFVAGAKDRRGPPGRTKVKGMSKSAATGERATNRDADGLGDVKTLAAEDDGIDGESCVITGIWRPQRSVVVDSRYDRCREIAEEIIALVKASAYDHRQQYAISMTLHEAIANAIKHGNRSSPFKKVRFEYSVNELEVRVRITDEGDGFDIRSVRDPRVPENLDKLSGRGLLLMREMTSGVRFNSVGNQVEFWKRRNPSQGR